MSDFGREALLETAGRHQTRPLASIGEIAKTNFDAQWELETMMGQLDALRDAYETDRRTLYQLTGKRLFNPFNADPDARTRLEHRYQQERDKLLGQDYPELVGNFTPDTVREQIAAQRADVRKKAADVEDRTFGFWRGATAYGSRMGAATLDLPVLGSMFFAAPAASGILTTALIEGGVNAGSEALVQGAVQSGRRQFGEEPNLGEAAQNVLLAGGGGAVFGAAAKGLGLGARALLDRYRSSGLRSADADAAAAFLERKLQMEESNPFLDTPLGRAEHARRLDEAITRFRETLPQADTAIGRAMEASDGVHLRPEISVRQRPQTAAEIGDAFRQTIVARHPEFEPARQIESIDSQLADVNAERASVDEKLAAPAEEAKRAQLSKLREELDATTNRRKIKRLERKIDELSTREDVPINQIRAERTKLLNRRAELENTAERLGSQRQGALRRLDHEQARALDLRRNPKKPSIFATIEQHAPDVAELPKLKEGMTRAADIADKVARAVQANPRAPRVVSRDTSSPTSAGVSEIIAPTDKAAQTAKETVFEEQMAEHLKVNPDERITLIDEDTGALRTVTAKQLAEEFQEDQKFINELNDCIRSALS